MATKIKKFEAPDRVKPKTLLIASLTAITVALISTRLTNTVNSVVLVGIASMLSALVSEAYRISIEAFNNSVKRQVNRALKRQHIEVDAETGELQVVEDEIVEPRASSVPPAPRSLSKRILNSRFTTPVLFALIGLVTVASSFLISSIAPDNQIIVSKEVVERKQLSQAEKRLLEQRADEAAQEEAAEAKDEALAGSKELIDLTREELVLLIETLRGEIATLKTELASQQTSSGELATSNQELLTALQDLTDRVEELEGELAAESPDPLPEEPGTITQGNP